MRLSRRLRWWGLFALLPLIVALIVLDDDAPFPMGWHYLALAAIAALVCALAIRWVERNSELMEREGADSLVAYRPLLGAPDEERPEQVAPDPQPTGRGRSMFGYDAMASPPVINSRSDSR